MAVAVATVCLGFRSTLTFHCSVLASAPSSRNPLFTLALQQKKIHKAVVTHQVAMDCLDNNAVTVSDSNGVSGQQCCYSVR